jgi:hypothetical protein
MNEVLPQTFRIIEMFFRAKYLFAAHTGQPLSKGARAREPLLLPVRQRPSCLGNEKPLKPDVQLNNIYIIIFV